jgi:ferritin-like metal-binding protein YciE
MTLHDLLLLKVRSLYDIETILLKALPALAHNSTNQELKKVFRDHLNETRAHGVRLENIFAYFGQAPKKTKVEAIRGLVKDAEWVMDTIHDKAARDVALIGAAEYVEHYETAGYEVALEWAQELGYREIAELLAETMREEIKAGEKLRELGVIRLDKRALPAEMKNAEPGTFFGLLSA